MTKKVTAVALLDESALKTAIGSIRTAGKKLDHAIHVAALSAISIADKTTGTGNIFYVNALFLAMPKGARHAALTLWLTTFGAVEANKGESKDTKPFIHATDKKLDMDGAQKTPWYELAPSKKPDEELDIAALVNAILSKVAKKVAKDGEDSVKHHALVPKLTELVAAIADEEGTTGEPSKQDADPLETK